MTLPSESGSVTEGVGSPWKGAKSPVGYGAQGVTATRRGHGACRGGGHADHPLGLGPDRDPFDNARGPIEADVQPPTDDGYLQAGMVNGL